MITLDPLPPQTQDILLISKSADRQLSVLCVTLNLPLPCDLVGPGVLGLGHGRGGGITLPSTRPAVNDSIPNLGVVLASLWFLCSPSASQTPFLSLPDEFLLFSHFPEVIPSYRSVFDLSLVWEGQQENPQPCGPREQQD